MNWNFNKMSQIFNTTNKKKLLLSGSWGLEKEAQRVSSSGDLALTPHPNAFGDKLKNPYITTDFSESQIEIITPPFKKIEETYDYLNKLSVQVENNIGNEFMWPFSMPPRLPDEKDIPLAKFEDSSYGREKEIYRRGLALRYGKKMQMISGIHYNFALGDDILTLLHSQFGEKYDFRSFTDGVYFHMIRNYLKYRWIIIYLFGASPSIDKTYFSVINEQLETISKCCPECYDIINKYEEFSTSLRVSRFGYSNSNDSGKTMYYDDLTEYIDTINNLLQTKSQRFSKLGIYKDGIQIQLNDNVLQKESEFYSSIRPKQVANNNESQLTALKQRGVKYLEVRILDLNPFYKSGISLTELYFLQIFMLFCLFFEDSYLSEEDILKANKNHNIVALCGRKPGLNIYRYDGTETTLNKWGKEIFESFFAIAKLIDEGTCSNKYEKAVALEAQKLFDVSLLPSSMVETQLKENNNSFIHFGINRAISNKTDKFNKEEAV